MSNKDRRLKIGTVDESSVHSEKEVRTIDVVGRFVLLENVEDSHHNGRDKKNDSQHSDPSIVATRTITLWEQKIFIGTKTSKGM